MSKKFAIIHSSIFAQGVSAQSHYTKMKKNDYGQNNNFAERLLEDENIFSAKELETIQEQEFDDIASQLSSQLHYSLKTLIDHKNDEIADIYIYSNKAYALKNLFKKTQEKNNINLDLNKFKFINFDYFPPKEATVNPVMCLHKWENILRTFLEKEYEAVLWIDADTYINSNLEYLFNRFKDIDYVAAKMECLYFKKETRFYHTLDSGVMLFTKKVLNKLNLTPDQFRKKQVEKIVDLCKKAESIIDINHNLGKWNIHNFTTWVVEQVAGEDVLRDFGIKCTGSLHEEGHMAAWPDQIGGMFHFRNGECRIHEYPICHYKNYYGPIFVPKEFWHEKIDGTIPLKTLFDSSPLLAVYGSSQIRCKKCGLPWTFFRKRDKYDYLVRYPEPFNVKKFLEQYKSN